MKKVLFKDSTQYIVEQILVYSFNDFKTEVINLSVTSWVLCPWRPEEGTVVSQIPISAAKHLCMLCVYVDSAGKTELHTNITSLQSVKNKPSP